jgi:hypothetical protein
VREAPSPRFPRVARIPEIRRVESNGKQSAVHGPFRLRSIPRSAWPQLEQLTKQRSRRHHCWLGRPEQSASTQWVLCQCSYVATNRGNPPLRQSGNKSTSREDRVHFGAVDSVEYGSFQSRHASIPPRVAATAVAVVCAARGGAARAEPPQLSHAYRGCRCTAHREPSRQSSLSRLLFVRAGHKSDSRNGTGLGDLRRTLSHSSRTFLACRWQGYSHAA